LLPYVVVDELLFKEGRAVTPVESEFIDKARGGDLATAVAHPACGDQLPHEGVDQRIVGVARAPSRKMTGLEGG
jgi:hypothetical protein